MELISVDDFDTRELASQATPEERSESATVSSFHAA